MEKSTLLTIIAVKNDCFSIVYLTGIEKQTHTNKPVGFTIECKNCNCNKLIAAHCPDKGIVGQNFECNFICALIAIMKVYFKLKNV